MVRTEDDLGKKLPPAVESSDSRVSRWVVPGALTLLYIALVAVQITRHLWFDELLTYHIAQAPSLGRLLELVKRWDLNPPPLHLLAHISLVVAHGNPVAIRLPSVLEFYIASVLLFLYSDRKLGRAFAPIAVLLVWYSSIFQYATEARPYAALCMWFCALLLLRDMALRGAPRRSVLFAIAICSAGLLTAHVFGLLTLVAFGAAEAVLFTRTRKADYRLWAAFFLPSVVIVFYLPLFRNYSAITDYPVAFQAGMDKAASFYWHTFLSVSGCLLLMLLCAWVRRGQRRFEHRSRLHLDEWALFLGLALMPIALNFALSTGHAPFWGRYCITSAVAIYLVFGILPAALTRYDQRSGYAAAVAASALILVQNVLAPIVKNRLEPEPADAAMLAAIKPDLPVVAASGLTFVEMGQYEKPQVRARLFYLRDRAAALQFAHATIFEDLSDFQQAFKLPGTVESYRQFIQDHHAFLVLGTFNYPEDWLLRKLSTDGAEIIPLGVYRTPYKDKTLYEVHLRGKA